MHSDPREQFLKWYEEAKPKESHDGTAMALATVDESGYPDCRVVLFKGLNADGFRFFTNYNSPKAQQLTNSPYAALAFHWPNTQRQVRVRGRVERLSAPESDEYFASRGRDSQLSAWASPQSRTVDSRQELEQMKAEVVLRHDGEVVKRPDFWGGFVLNPSHYEFWQERPARFHDRFRYKLEGLDWIIERLAP